MTDLSERTANAVLPAVAIDEKGNVIVAWAQAKKSDWTVQVAERPAGGAWGKPVPLSAPATNVASPQLAIAGSHVVAIWDRYDGKNLIAQAAERNPTTHAWTTPISLSAPGTDAQSPRIAIDAKGDMIAVWSSVDLAGWTVDAAYRKAGGLWQSPVPLESPQAGTAAPDVVLDSTGDAVVAWASTNGAGWRVHVSAGGAAGTWESASDISGPDPTGSIAPKLALEGTNDVTAVWSRFLGPNTVIETSTRSAATGVWSPARQLFTPGPDALAPQIAVDRRGDGVLVWTSSSASRLSVAAAFRAVGKGWGPAVVLATATTGALAPQVAIDARGDVLAIWTRVVGGFSRVQASSLAAGSRTWSPPRTLSRGGGDVVTPQAALDGGGDGALAWARYTGQSFVIQGEGYDRTGPALTRLSMPASGVVGKKLVFAVTPSDVWTSVRTIRWSFGDGGAGSGRLTGHVYKRPGRYRAVVTATDGFGHVTSVRRWIRILAA